MRANAPSVSLTLDLEEYILTCYILEEARLFVVGNLTAPNSPDQLRETLENAKTTLTEKKLLAIDSHGNVEMDFVLAKMVSTVCKAPWTLIAKKTRADTTQEMFIHMGSDLLVEQITGADKVELTALENISILLERLKAWLALPDAPKAPGELIELEADIFDKARHIAQTDGLEICEKFLLAHQVLAQAAKILATALGKDGWTGSFTLLDRSKEQPAPIETLGWLNCLEGSYCVFPRQSAERDLIHLFPVSTEGIWKRVIKILDQ